MRLPAIIGKYRLEEFLGGGMAEVYRAEDTVLGRQVAFKQLSPSGIADDGVRARFLEEARTCSQLSHDNIVRTFDYGEEDGQPFIVMELLKGEPLSARMKTGALGDIGERARIALEMARALEYLHGQQILHRDLKPDNVHIEAGSGRARLIDLGIAKSEGMNLTQTGFVVPGADRAPSTKGTPFYMAPEQLTGAPVGKATDVYAFGLVLFELLTGKRARSGETAERVLEQILRDPVDYAPLAEAAVPEPLAEIVRDATQSEVERRPQGFGAIIARLEAFVEGIALIESNARTESATVEPVAKPAIVMPPRERLQFGHTAGMALIAAILGGLAVGLLGVSLARARLPERATAQSVGRNEGMVAIPGGDFQFEQQRRTIYLGPFEMDRTEVTNEQYASFCKAKHRPLPAGFHEDWPGQPVTGVTIEEARAYCFAQAKHLPTEEQWERAARGTGGARFPWGDTPDATRANVEGGGGHLVAADSMPLGASAEGVLHLIGNAAEWVDQQRTPSVLALDKFAELLKPPAMESEPWYIIKGGSFRRSVAESAADLWLPAPGRYAADDLGFRCAR